MFKTIFRPANGGRFPLAAALLCMLLAGMVSLDAKDPDKAAKEKDHSLAKGTAYNTRYAVLNINNLSTFHRSDGLSNHSPASDNGLYYPRFTSWAIYQDGMMWGAKPYQDAAKTKPAGQAQPIRVGGANYVTGTQPGRIIGTGATAVADDPNNPLVRSYRIRRDYYTMSEDELKKDAANVYEITIGAVTATLMAEVAAQYALDWTQWPVAWGAPYIDRNNNGRYDPPPAFSATFNADSLISQGKDEPGVAGSDPNSPADQVIWQVFNDLSRALTIALQGSEPMGLEIQKTLWGYKRADALGNLYFQRYKILNKGGAVIDDAGTKGTFFMDSMYVAQWSDPDLGGAGDDLIGCDTLLSMGYVYNGVPIDLEYRKYNLPPPSSGYDFLAGPIVPAAGRTAVFDLKYKPGFRNLGMTSFSWFSAGAAISDPPRSYSQGTIRWYKMLRGWAPVDGADSFYPWDPKFLPAGVYPLSGDPVTGKGYVDGQGTSYSFPPGDRRLNLSTGPFSMAPGDTQEVTVGVVVGLGSDRFSSVSVLKFNDRFAQNTFDALFAVPRAPSAPDVKVAELDGEVVLEWGSNLTRVSDVETRVSNPGAYKFEGYNIYQFPSVGSTLKDAKRILTMDLLTDPAVVLDEQFDETSGLILFKPVQFGSNSGILRFFKLDKDYVRDLPRLYNGQEYYVAVTAYAVATVPGFLPAVLESSPSVMAVRPQVPFGKVLSIKSGDTLKVTKVGTSDGTIRPIVINPLAGTGNSYEVTFQEDPTTKAMSWTLKNKTKNTTLLSGEKNQTGDDNYKFVEGGIFLKVEGPPPGMKDWAIPNGSRRFTWADGWTGFEGFEGTIGWNEPAYYFGSISEKTVKASQLKDVLLKLAAASSGTATNPNAGGNPYGGWDVDNPGADPNFSYAYRYLRGATAAAARPEFAPYIINKTSGYPYQDYKRGVPFSAWDMEATPPVRLAVGIHENNVAAGLVDGKWWPPANGTTVTQSAVRDMVFIFNTPYTGATPDPAFFKNALADPLPVMYWLGVNRRGGANFSAGDEFMIYANHVNTTATVFTYTNPAPVVSTENQIASADKVGVFPNPYYASNPAETNRFARFVTFNFLPAKATIRIFNIAGQLVTTLQKDDASQFTRWNLTNKYNFPVASGMYIAHIDMPDLGITKILKLAIIQEQELLDVY